MKGAFRIDEVWQKIAECLRPFVFVQEGWLFGSFAYGTPNSYSDIDLCVVVDDGADVGMNYGEVKFAISEGIRGRWPVDLVMVEVSKADKLKNRRDLVYFDVFNKGKLLFIKENAQ